AYQHEPALLTEAERRTRIDALVDVVVNIYAPLPGSSLSFYIRRLRYAVQQWRNEIPAAQKRARERPAHARAAGVDWHWPEGENLRRAVIPKAGRLLAPTDPAAHDRTRAELLSYCTYRFEAYP